MSFVLRCRVTKGLADATAALDREPAKAITLRPCLLSLDATRKPNRLANSKIRIREAIELCLAEEGQDVERLDFVGVHKVSVTR